MFSLSLMSYLIPFWSTLKEKMETFAEESTEQMAGHLEGRDGGNNTACLSAWGFRFN